MNTPLHPLLMNVAAVFFKENRVHQRTYFCVVCTGEPRWITDSFGNSDYIALGSKVYKLKTRFVPGWETKDFHHCGRSSLCPPL